MSKNRKITAAAFAIGALALMVGVYGIGTTYAQDNDAHISLIQKLASKFGVEESEVQAVFDEHQQEMQTERQAEFSNKLDEAVEAEEITSGQKQAILDKHEEMKNRHKELKDLDPEERQAQMRELRKEMRDWAEENGIDMRDIAPKGEKGIHDGKGMGGHGGPRF
ncbi:hypothetical protein KJ903_02045 [Patescibacteria group bacterium]|nr:hypothetical protein [Patescibacteria group bacterium]